MDISELVHNDHSFQPLKRHPCHWPGCHKLFSRPSDASRHYRIHTNDRPFQCIEPHCGKRFIQKSALTVHLRTHSGERPHKCEFTNCQKRFSDSSSLARHRRIHTGNRPYKCHECMRSYTKKTLLVQHIRIFHDKKCSNINKDRSPLLPYDLTLPAISQYTSTATAKLYNQERRLPPIS